MRSMVTTQAPDRSPAAALERRKMVSVDAETLTKAVALSRAVLRVTCCSCTVTVAGYECSRCAALAALRQLEGRQ